MTIRTKAAAALLAATALGGTALPAAAEVELSFFTGYQTAPHSRVKGNDPGGAGEFNFLAEWEGKSMAMPPYYGLRATWWRSERLGYGVEFNHTKVYASDSTKKSNGFDTLEFTDGLNILTANVMYRWPGEGRITPYVGGGLGISIPHVEVNSGAGETFEYQVGGPAVAWVAGASYAIDANWAVFGEYRGTYSMNDVDLVSGGNLKTNIVTNALNIGVSYRF